MLRPTAALAAALLLTAACGKGSDLPASATYGPDVKLAAPGEGRADPDAQPGAGRRLAGGRSADGAGGVHRDPLRRGPGPSALALPAAERRRAGGRDQQPAAPEEGADRLHRRADDEAGRGAVPSANRITLLRDANGDGKPDLGLHEYKPSNESIVIAFNTQSGADVSMPKSVQRARRLQDG